MCSVSKPTPFTLGRESATSFMIEMLGQAQMSAYWGFVRGCVDVRPGDLYVAGSALRMLVLGICMWLCGC